MNMVELTAASKLFENSLNSVSVSPRSISGCVQFNKTLMIAWVAQALLMTYNIKHTEMNGLT